MPPRAVPAPSPSACRTPAAITVTVRNASERSLHATLSASVESKPPTPKKLPTLDTREVDLAAGETREVFWEVTAPINATALEWRVDAIEGAGGAVSADAARDAFKIDRKSGVEG